LVRVDSSPSTFSVCEVNRGTGTLIGNGSFLQVISWGCAASRMGADSFLFFLLSQLPAGDADVRLTLVSRTPWWYVKGHKGVALLGNSSSADMSLRSSPSSPFHQACSGLASDRRCELWNTPGRLRIQVSGVESLSMRFDGLKTQRQLCR